MFDKKNISFWNFFENNLMKFIKFRERYWPNWDFFPYFLYTVEFDSHEWILLQFISNNVMSKYICIEIRLTLYEYVHYIPI